MHSPAKYEGERPEASGQTKQFFGRNTETETRPPGKAEISAETEILAETRFSAETVYFGRNSLFRPKCFVSARTIYGFTLDLLPKSGPKHVFFGQKRLYLISAIKGCFGS